MRFVSLTVSNAAASFAEFLLSDFPLVNPFSRDPLVIANVGSFVLFTKEYFVLQDIMFSVWLKSKDQSNYVYVVCA